jgi:hypothetical protein
LALVAQVVQEFLLKTAILEAQAVLLHLVQLRQAVELVVQVART